MSSPTKRKDTDAAPEPDSKKPKQQSESEGNGQVTETTAHRFKDFVLDEVLGENAQTKVAFVRGHFPGKEGQAVVTLEKTSFDKQTLEKILTEESETKSTLENDIYSTWELLPPRSASGMKTSLIFPATEKHIKKYRHQEISLIEESAENYQDITLPYLEKESFSLQWVYNILEKKTEADRIVFEDPDPTVGFVLLPDMKWDRRDVRELYLVCIINRHGVKSLRDLTTEHLPLLDNIRSKATTAIFDKFGVPASKLRVYLHYQPSYYHLHVHFTHVSLSVPGSGVERAHLLSDVVQNISSDPGYYSKRALSFTARETDGLYQRYKEAGLL